jgi:ankyrin repeat protein
VELLLQNGACPNFEDEYGQTPLARAVEEGSVPVLQLLLDGGAKIDYKYTLVSACNYIRWVSLRLVADVIILGYFRK